MSKKIANEVFENYCRQKGYQSVDSLTEDDIYMIIIIYNNTVEKSIIEDETDGIVTINKFLKPTTCQLYNFRNELVGTVENEYQFNDIRIQIKENKLYGYYFMFKGHRADITIDGGVEIKDGVKGFYDLLDKQLEILLF